MPRSRQLGDGLLEGPHEGTVIRQPAAIEDLLDTFQQTLAPIASIPEPLNRKARPSSRWLANGLSAGRRRAMAIEVM